MSVRVIKLRHDRHGPVSRVEDDGEFLGTVSKWHGMWTCVDPDGHAPCQLFDRRMDAIETLVELKEMRQ